MKTIIKTTVIAFIFMALTTSCNKDKKNYGKMVVRMTDAPADFTEVNVEIKEVQVHYADHGWYTLRTNTGIYNLLLLQNDVTEVIAEEEELKLGKITQMRLILGQKNTVAIQDTIYPLELSSQHETGLKLNTNVHIIANKEVDLLLDFDAEKSVIIEGNGSFKLKPTIKIESIIIH